MTATKTSDRQIAREEIRLGLAALTPVVSWISAQQIGFILSPWVCTSGHRWVLTLVMSVAFAAAAAGGAATWRIWKRLPGDRGRRDLSSTRQRVIAAGGLLLAAIFLVAIVALAIPTLVHRPCD